MTASPSPSGDATVDAPHASALPAHDWRRVWWHGHNARRAALRQAADWLVDSALGDSAGTTCAVSYYDTAQVVRQWLRHPGRLPEAVALAGLGLLRRSQNRDGSWGCRQAPAQYRLVPTLATVACLLEVVAADIHAAPATVPALREGLAFLTRDPTVYHPGTVPDTVAIELILPALLTDLEHLVTADERLPARFLDGLRAGLALQTANLRRLRAARQACLRGESLKKSLLFSCELFAGPPVPADPAALFLDGHVACSPASTAAVLGWCPQPPAGAFAYLERESARLGGGLPDVAPLTVFERAWTASLLIRSGITPAPARARGLADYLDRCTSAEGAPFAPGLIPDGDDTAVALFTLYRLGRHRSPAPLLRFETGTGFLTYFEERTASPSVNAHALDALAAIPRLPSTAGALRAQVGTAIDKATLHLLDSQRDDGSWQDKWHASPFYATACCVLALSDPAVAPSGRTRAALRRAVGWALASQRADGSWGHWCGTKEETAHALHILLSARTVIDTVSDHARPIAQAAERGANILLTDPLAADPVPMWHSKDLYSPLRVVNAVVLTALYRHAMATTGTS